MEIGIDSFAAAPSRTERIRLTSAVTVLSAADPVRAFQMDNAGLSHTQLLRSIELIGNQISPLINS